MRIGRLAAPVHALGPGKRVCLWTKGCPRRCPGCISPELQLAEGPDTDVRVLSELLMQAADRNGCTGLTISGGDPFYQADELAKLLKLIRRRFEDILVYSGYALEEIRERCGPAGEESLGVIDVLIDGVYMEERNHPDCVLRGSDNQVIHFLNPSRRAAYEEYMKQGRMMECFMHDNTMIIVGIPNE